jgi:hypothetical protein
MTSEFFHYDGCKRDPDNCGACALTIPVLIDGKMGLNYAAWPLSYMQNGRRIPQKFHDYLLEELDSDNKAYVENLKNHLKFHGYDIEVIRRSRSEKI